MAHILFLKSRVPDENTQKKTSSIQQAQQYLYPGHWALRRASKDGGRFRCILCAVGRVKVCMYILYTRTTVRYSYSVGHQQAHLLNMYKCKRKTEKFWGAPLRVQQAQHPHSCSYTQAAEATTNNENDNEPRRTALIMIHDS